MCSGDMWLVRKVAPAEKASRPSQKWVDAPRGEMPREKRAVCPRPEGLGKAAWLQEEHSERSGGAGGADGPLIEREARAPSKPSFLRLRKVRVHPYHWGAQCAVRLNDEPGFLVDPFLGKGNLRLGKDRIKKAYQKQPQEMGRANCPISFGSRNGSIRPSHFF